MLEHQKRAFEHLNEWKVGALFMEAGTGKTRVACEIINSTKCDVVVWIAPLRTISPVGNNPSIKEEILKWAISPEKFVYFGAESISSSNRIYLSLYELVKSNNCFVVVDESLKIKNAEAKRTKRILKIGKFAEYKLILNGTPLSKNLLDLWSQMEFLSPKILNMSLSQFKNSFCNYTTITKRFGSRCVSREFITGYENVDYLYHLIGDFVFECDLHLNIKKNIHELYYHIDATAKECYQELKRKYLDDEMMELKNNNIFLEMTQQMQHTYCCTEEKFKRVEELFDTIPEENTIIFCKYIKSREECERRFPKAKVLSYQRESLGLNLQNYNYTIYFDKIWDYALTIQAGHRTYRIGQQFDCQYYNLTGDVGLESMITNNLAKKINLTEYFKTKTIKELNEEL